jgi:hypothetical protein
MEGIPGEENPRTSPVVMYPSEAAIASSSCKRESVIILIMYVREMEYCYVSYLITFIPGLCRGKGRHKERSAESLSLPGSY